MGQLLYFIFKTYTIHTSKLVGILYNFWVKLHSSYHLMQQSLSTDNGFKINYIVIYIQGMQRPAQFTVAIIIAWIE